MSADFLFEYFFQLYHYQYGLPLLILAFCTVFLFFSLYFFYKLLKSEQPDNEFNAGKFNLYMGFSLLVFVVVIITTSWAGLRLNKQKVLSDAEEMLKSVRDTSIESLMVWLQNKSSVIQHIGKNEQLVSYVEQLMQQPPNKQALLQAEVTQALRKFHQQEKPILGGLGFFVIDRNNINIGSMRDSNLGAVNLIAEQKPALLKRVFNGETVFIPPVYSDVHIKTAKHRDIATPPTMFIATPIKNKAGAVIAVFTNRLDPGMQFSEILRTGRIGESGETYAVDSRGLLISESRFEDHLLEIGLLEQSQSSVLSITISDPGVNLSKGLKAVAAPEQRPLTKMAQQVLKRNIGQNVDGYRDYRGVRVIGAWAWLPKLGIGITTEIDEEEALSSYFASRNVIIFILTIVVLVTLGTFVFIISMAMRTNRVLHSSRDELETKVIERTAQIRAKESQFRHILQSSPIAILMSNQQGAITFANNGASTLLGCDQQTLLTMTEALIYASEDDYESIQTELKAKGHIYNKEVKFIRRDQTEGWGLMSLVATEFKSQATTLIWCSDISEHKKYEVNLAVAKEQAEKASQAKSDFLSSMSHELRTPLNAILGFGQLLKIDVEDEESISNVVEILKAGEHLLRLINDILDLAAIESGKLSLSIENVLLDDVFTECFSLITPLAEQREIYLQKPVSRFRVKGDYMRIKQVLLNLLSNAIKYNQNKGRVDVECVALSKETIRITVTDTGIGLSEEDQQQIFQEFNRMGLENSNIEGTGIGLVISKRLVEMMDGRIGVQSGISQGSSFWIELQAYQSEMEGAAANLSENLLSGEQQQKERIQEKTGKTILYVEDNPANLTVVTKVIQKHSSYDLISAPDGKLGIDLAFTHLPDLILLDINLPGQSGYDILKILQRNDATKSIPVIAVTANARDSDIKKGMDAGFTDYITKPINIAKLLSAVNNILEDE